VLRTLPPAQDPGGSARARSLSWDSGIFFENIHKKQIVKSARCVCRGLELDRDCTGF
jgi:hypothetical protein